MTYFSTFLDWTVISRDEESNMQSLGDCGVLSANGMCSRRPSPQGFSPRFLPSLVCTHVCMHVCVHVVLKTAPSCVIYSSALALALFPRLSHCVWCLGHSRLYIFSIDRKHFYLMKLILPGFSPSVICFTILQFTSNWFLYIEWCKSWSLSFLHPV